MWCPAVYQLDTFLVLFRAPWAHSGNSRAAACVWAEPPALDLGVGGAGEHSDA